MSEPSIRFDRQRLLRSAFLLIRLERRAQVYGKQMRDHFEARDVPVTVSLSYADQLSITVSTTRLNGGDIQRHMNQYFSEEWR